MVRISLVPALTPLYLYVSTFRSMCTVPNIIIIIIIIRGISFMQGTYTYIPETKHVPREHCVATILM